jgi:LAO/AO transport system kinase
MAHCTREVIHVLDAAGYDVILVETVGVGQAELDVMHVADSVAVVLHPEAGDMVQVMKAGIMEISDLYIINKADLPGADRLHGQLQEMLHIGKKEGEWHPPIHSMIATRGEGVQILWKQLLAHKAFQQENGEWLKRRGRNAQYEIKEMLTETIHKHLHDMMNGDEFIQDLHEVAIRRRNPYEVSQKWVHRFRCT